MRHSAISLKDDRRGFTLLETIIAMAIMVLALASILAVESASINASTRAQQMNTVAMLAKNTMVDLEYKVQGKSFDEVKKEDGGTFEAPYQDYQWKTSVKEIEFPNLNAGNAKASEDSNAPPGQGEMAELITKLVTNFLSKAVREMTVTILWQRGGAEQTFTVSTYWVDLNHEFQMSEQ